MAFSVVVFPAALNNVLQYDEQASMLRVQVCTGRIISETKRNEMKRKSILCSVRA